MKVYLSCIQDILKLTKASNVSIIAKDKIYVVANEIKDYEFKGQIVISSDASYEEEGKTVISKDVLKLVPKNTLVTVKEDMIVAGNRKIKYTPNNEVDKPIKVENYLTTIPAGELKHLLSGHYAMSTSLVRPILNGICINKSDFVALDGFRMTVRNGNFKANEEIIFDMNLANMIKKIKCNEDVEIYYNDRYVKFKFGELEVVGNRIQGDYIKYESIIPEDYTTKVEEIETEYIVDILKDYKRNKLEIVKLNFEKYKLTISSMDKELTVVDNLNVNVLGKPLEIAFNVNYLLDVLKNYKIANFELSDSVSPLVVRSNNKLDLVLPVRIR